MSTSIRAVGFTDNELSEEVPGGPFRLTGLISFLLGLISVGALTSTMLLVFPVLGVLFGLLALRPSSAASGKPGGRKFALLGIALSLLFGTWSYSYFASREHYLGNQARVFAEDWLLMVRHGQPQMAFELTKPISARVLDDMSLVDYYSPKNKSQFEQYDMFSSRSLIRDIVNAEIDPEWVFDGVLAIYTTQQVENVVVLFTDATGKLQPAQINLCRMPDTSEAAAARGGNPMTWYVSNFDMQPASQSTGFESSLD